MGQKTQERVIDDIKYTTTQFPTTKGLEVAYNLAKFASGPLAPFASLLTGGKKTLDVEFNAQMIGAGLQTFFMTCDEKTFVKTTQSLLTSTTREGKPVNFEIDFAGELAHLMKVLAFVIEVNFQDFFGALRALAAKQTQAIGPEKQT